MKLSRLTQHLRTSVIYCALFVFALFALAPQAHAQGWPNEPCGAEFDDADLRGSVSQCPYVKRTQDAAISGISCGILPVMHICTEDESRLQGMYQKSVIGSLNNYIAMMYQNPPASTYAFVQDMGQTLGFIPKSAYAQGIGFSGLAALLPIWKAFRNIAYLLLAIVMIVIGFMVMFRKKIDPKTVVTVQNALPRIVITLLLITFSYAIVGFMIDLMYLSLIFIVSILVSVGKDLPSDLATKYASGAFWQVVGSMFTGGWQSLDDIIALLGIGGTGTTAAGVEVVGLLGALFLGGVSWPVAGVGLAVAPVLFVFLLVLVILFAIVRIFFLLVNAYISIIISLITAPLQILPEAIPGVNSFGSWFRNLIANTAVFPITAALLAIGRMLTAFADPLLHPGTPLWGPPLLAPSGSQGLTGLVGLGILMSIPTIVNSVKEALKAKPMVPGGPGVIFGPLAGAAGTVLQTGYQFAFFSSMFKKKPPEGK